MSVYFVPTTMVDFYLNHFFNSEIPIKLLQVLLMELLQAGCEDLNDIK